MKFNPRTMFLLLYCFSNIAATFIFLDKGALGGDFKNFPINDPLLLIVSCISVVLSYILILTVIFNKLSLKFLSSNAKKKPLNKSMHFFVLILQIAFLYYCMKTGAYIAGSTIKVDSIIKYLWIMLPVDYIFLVYYSLARETKYFKYNVAIYVLSNIIRGWTGFFVLVFFLESYHQFIVKNKKIKKKHIISILFLLIIVVPLLISVKWAVRAADTVSLDTLLIIIDSALTNLLQNTEVDGVDVLYNFFVMILERLQHVANIYQLAAHSDAFWEELVNGTYLPFIFEGLPQYTITQAFGIKYVDLHVYLPQYFYGDKFQGINNSFHTGFVGWLFISPFIWIFYLLYMFFLVAFSMLLMKRLNSELGKGLIWLCILMFIMNGWLNAYVNFIMALMFFNLIVSLRVTREKNSEIEEKI